MRKIPDRLSAYRGKIMCAERCRVLVDGVVLRRIIEMTEGWRLVLECLPYILKNVNRVAPPSKWKMN